MKRIAYLMSLVVLGLASCTKFDDAVTENYGDGPSIDVKIEAGVPSDSVFTIYITPAKGTTYYSYVIDINDEPEKLDNYTLLKGAYSGTVVQNTATKPADTIVYATAIPNTNYLVYAVACNDKGIAGNVSYASIKTTDAGTPFAMTIKRNPAENSVELTFSERMKRGAGKVTAKYYKEWDIFNPVEIPEDEIEVVVGADMVAFFAPTAPNGAIVAYSWEAGAFTDYTGNACGAQNSGLNMTTGRFTGAYVQIPYVPFEVTDDNLVSPADGSLVADWTTFEGVFNFHEAIFRLDDNAQLGDLSVIYTNDVSVQTIKLDTAHWNIKDDSLLVFRLPKAPEAGDMITVEIVEGAVTDVFGNPNAAFSSDISWKYFAMTKEMAVGDFEVNIVSYWSETEEYEVFDSISIEFDPAVENGLIIKGLQFDDAEIKGRYDLDAGKIIIDAGQLLGETAKYVVYFNVYNATEVSFSVNPDGTMTADGLWGIYLIDASDKTTGLGWSELAVASELVPYTDAAPAPAR